MGSPCNAYGNEPTGALNLGTAASTGNVNNRGPSTASVIVAPAGGAKCTSNPQFWGAIAGPNTPKGNGDAFMTRTCGSGNSGCTGTTNNEFNPLGYFYIVRVGAGRRRRAHDLADLRPGLRPGRRRVRRTDRAGPSPATTGARSSRSTPRPATPGAPPTRSATVTSSTAGPRPTSSRRTASGCPPTPTSPSSPRRSCRARSSTPATPPRAPRRTP